MRTPEEAAKNLIEDNFPISQYIKLQNRRKERLALFKERNIAILIKNELELIKFGEEVLKLLKENDRRSNNI